MSVTDPSADSIIFADDKMTLENVSSFVPTGNRIVGKIIDDPRKEKVLKSGLIIPNDILGGKDPYVTVKAISVGRGVITHEGIIPTEVQAGDICLVFNGKWFELKEKDGLDKDGNVVKGDSFIIFSENDIVALYNDHTKKV